jgi:DNA-binding transcriptional LysR family regulator
VSPWRRHQVQVITRNVPDIRAKELQAVIALAEYGSFVAAAAFLKTSQPALTRTLKHIEKALGVTLFARSTRRVEITQAGREFVAVAERVLNDLHITMRNMHDVSSEQRGQVIVSTYSAFAYQVLPPILQAYRDRRPQVDIRLREGRQPDILEDVRSGVADFGVGFVDGLAASVNSTTLRREPLYVIVPAGHRLAAGRPDQIRFADACMDSLVSLPVDSYTRPPPSTCATRSSSPASRASSPTCAPTPASASSPPARCRCRCRRTSMRRSSWIRPFT